MLIGVEMATGDASVDLSQMPPNLKRFFTTYFASDPLENLDLLAAHEPKRPPAGCRNCPM